MERDNYDDDLELLEALLDGALTPAEAESLGRRLAGDPVLAAELQRLRGERTARRAVWESYEPGMQEAAGLSAAALAAATHTERLRRGMLLVRRGIALVAMVMVAFAGGWLARGMGSSHSPISKDASDGPAPFRVALTDEHGNIVAVQRFDDERKAREFADDVDRWQSRPRRVRAPGAEIFMPVSGEF